MKLEARWFLGLLPPLCWAMNRDEINIIINGEPEEDPYVDVVVEDPSKDKIVSSQFMSLCAETKSFAVERLALLHQTKLFEEMPSKATLPDDVELRDMVHQYPDLGEFVPINKPKVPSPGEFVPEPRFSNALDIMFGQILDTIAKNVSDGKCQCGLSQEIGSKCQFYSAVAACHSRQCNFLMSILAPLMQEIPVCFKPSDEPKEIAGLPKCTHDPRDLGEELPTVPLSMSVSGEINVPEVSPSRSLNASAICYARQGEMASIPTIPIKTTLSALTLFKI